MPRNLRKWISLLIAAILYYVVHEGGHLIVSLFLGTFEYIRIVYWGLGVQIVANTSNMTDIQIFIFSAAGVFCTLLTGYILVGARKYLNHIQSKLFRAIAYFTTLIFLCLDPFYLSILHRFVGGGDMNGLLLIGIPGSFASIFFFVMLGTNLLIFSKSVCPLYKKGFTESA